MDVLLVRRAIRGVSIGLVFLASAPTVAQAPDDGLPGAVAGIDASRERFLHGGPLPRPEDLAAHEEVLNRVAQSAAARKDWARSAEALIQLERAERSLSRWEPAIAYATKALEAARAARQGDLQARALLGRSRAELSRKGIAQATADIQDALRAAGQKAAVKLRFDLLSQQAAIESQVGKTNAAAETMDRAFALSGLKDEELVYGHMDRGAIYFQIGQRCDHEPAWNACLEALNESRVQYTRSADAAGRLGWSGLEKLARGQIAAVEGKAALLQRPDPRADDVKAAIFHPKTASDVLVTEAFAVGSQTGLAVAQVERAIQEEEEEARQFGGFALSSEARRLHVEGQLRQLKGDRVGALASFQRAVEVLEEDQRALPDDASRRAFFAQYFAIYVSAIQELLDARRFGDAFAMIEMSRARSMAALLAGRRLDLGGGKEGVLYGDSLKLERQIEAKLAQRFTLASQTPPAPGRMAQMDVELRRLREARQRLAARMATEAPRLQTLTTTRSVSLADLQALARSEGCEVIEYLVTEVTLIVIYIGPTEVRAKNVFLPRSELERAVNALQAELATPPGHAFDATRARELYLLLFAPVRKFVRGERLLILPHGILNALPFEVLEDPADGTPVGARFELSYAPSATIYAGLRSWNTGPARQLVAFGDPGLEAEAHEVERVSAVYHAGGGARSTERLVSKRKLRQSIRGADVLHLSVHGSFNGTEPLLSELALAPEGSDGGRLTAAEMFGLPLGKTALVVLSACESGRSTASIGNEELGMVRGLLYAGAGAVVLSRWKVSASSTALWMETFHREAQTHGLPLSARMALRALRADPRYAHPFHWAAFSLVGRQS